MSFIGAGIAQGAANVGKFVRGQEERDLRIQEAKLRQQAAAAQFKQQQEMAPIQTDIVKQQLEQQQLQLRQMQAAQFKANTYDAFRLYNADKDPKHLNNLVQQSKTSPVGSSLFGKTARVDAITNSAEHRKLLTQAGITDIDGLLQNKDLAGQFVVMTDTSGGQSLLDMNQVYAGTGFANQLANEELTRMSQQALIAQRLREGNSVGRVTALERLSKQMADDLGIPQYEAYERLSKKQTSAGSEKERLAQEILKQNPDMDYLDAYEQASQMGRAGSETERTARALSEKDGRPYEEVLRELQKEKQATAGQKDIAAANDTREELNKAFNGKFFETDFADPDNRRKALPMVTAIEKLTGRELTTEDKRVARQIRTLTALGNQGGKLTDKELGPIDTLLRDVKSYFVNDLGNDKNAIAAYASFRNIARNALFGASLTSSEIDAFNESMGKLSQQPGTVISKLRVQMDNLRNDMQAIYDYNDEYVSHYYLGKGLDELDDTISAIDERIDFLTKVDVNADKDAAKTLQVPRAPVTPVVDPSQPRKPLSEIFGASR